MAAAVERFAADREAGAAQLANEGKQSVGASTDRAATDSASAEPSAAGHVATGGADGELASVGTEPALSAPLDASAASEPDEPTRSNSDLAGVGDSAVQADAGGGTLLAAQVAAVGEPVDAGGVRAHSEAAAGSDDAALEQADAADAAAERAAAAPLVCDSAVLAAPPAANALAAAAQGTAVPAALAADPVADGRDGVEPAAVAVAELAPVARASASPDRVRGAGNDAAESEDEAALSAEDAQQAAAPAHTDLKDEAMLGEYEAKPAVQLVGADSGGDGHIKDEATAVVAAAVRNGTAHPPEAEAAEKLPAVKSDAEGDAKSDPLTPRENGRLKPKHAVADVAPKDEGKATGTAAKGYAGYRGEDGGGGGRRRRAARARADARRRRGGDVVRDARPQRRRRDPGLRAGRLQHSGDAGRTLVVGRRHAELCDECLVGGDPGQMDRPRVRDVGQQRAERDDHLAVEDLGELEHLLAEPAPAVGRLRTLQEHEVARSPRDLRRVDLDLGPVDDACRPLADAHLRACRLKVVELLGVQLGEARRTE